MQTNYKNRIIKLRCKMNELNVQAVLISSMPNMRYYSGFTGDSGIALITNTEQFLITDFRYREQAKMQLTDYEYVEFSSDSIWIKVNQICEDLCLSNIGFEESAITYADYEKMSIAMPSKKWIHLSKIMETQRAIKDEIELNSMRKAAKITDQTFEYLLNFIKVGMSEKDIALELEFFMRKKGAEGNSFNPIVASGENGSKPHAIVSNRQIELGDLVTLDFGCVVDGYCSDMTRTVGVGRLAPEQISVYNIVLEAQCAVLDNFKPNLSGQQVDLIARNIIDQYGYREQFGHGLGHSLGLEIHENPRFSPTCHEIIRKGMTMTNEPGIYIEGKFGVRIEDFGVVDDNGLEIFTHSTKKLICL